MKLRGEFTRGAKPNTPWGHLNANLPMHPWVAKVKQDFPYRRPDGGFDPQADAIALKKMLNAIQTSAAGERLGYLLTEDDVEPYKQRVGPRGNYDIHSEADIKVTGANDLRRLIADWQADRLASGDDPNRNFMKELAKLIRADKDRLGGLPVAQYNKKRPEKSMLTQKAEAIRQMQADRWGRIGGIPHIKRINSLTSSLPENLGFNPEQSESLLNTLRSSYTSHIDDVLLKQLQKQFKDNYIGRVDRFRGKAGKDIDDLLHEDQRDLRNLNQVLGGQQKEDNQSLANIIEGMGKNKLYRENELADLSSAFGNQQHTYDELVEQGNEKTHTLEAFEPYARLSKLADVTGRSKFEPGNPTSDQRVIDNLKAELANAGIEHNSGSSDTWTRNEKTGLSTDLPDSLIESLSPEMLASQYTLQRVDPKFKGEKYPRRKELQQGLLENTLAKRTYERGLPDIEDRIAGLNPRMKKEFKSELNKLSNRFMRLRQYGSRQHIKRAEQIARELSAKYAQSKSTIVDSTLKSKYDLAAQEMANERRELEDNSRRETEGFKGMLGQIEGTNKLGVTNWQSKQKAKDDEINAKLRELEFQTPYSAASGHINLNPAFGVINDDNFDKIIGEYIKRDPYAKVTDKRLGLSDLLGRRADYDAYKNAHKPRAAEINNSLQGVPQYDPMSREDLAYAQGEYKLGEENIARTGRERKEAAARRKKEALSKNVSQGLPNIKDARNHYNAYHDHQYNNPSIARESLNKLAKLIENEKGPKFWMNIDKNESDLGRYPYLTNTPNRINSILDEARAYLGIKPGQPGY